MENDRTRDRRHLLVLAVVLLLPFAMLAVWARSAPTALWETSVLLFLMAQPPPLDTVASTLNTLGNLPIWAIVIGISAVVTGYLRGLAAAFLVAISFASDLAAFGVKVLVERARPETDAVEQIFGLDSFSYPSGHTVRAAALAATLVWLFAPARYRLPLAVTAGALAGATMGFARVSLGVHWPTDTIGGTLLGLAWFALTAALIWVEPFRKLQRAEG